MCGKCMKNRYHIDKIRSPMVYDQNSSPLIMSLKNFYNLPAAKTVSKLIANVIKDLEVHCVVPVPLHFYRFIHRGYNQSEILARYVSENTGFPCLKDLLYRNRFTESQSKFNAKARSTNIRNAFSFNETYEISNQNILLVDDVYTTGSTVEECAKILKRNGASKVYVATGAITC